MKPYLTIPKGTILNYYDTKSILKKDIILPLTVKLEYFVENKELEIIESSNDLETLIKEIKCTLGYNVAFYALEENESLTPEAIKLKNETLKIIKILK